MDTRGATGEAVASAKALPGKHGNEPAPVDREGPDAGHVVTSTFSDEMDSIGDINKLRNLTKTTIIIL